MKKFMKVLLAFVLMLSLSACTSDGGLPQNPNGNESHNESQNDTYSGVVIKGKENKLTKNVTVLDNDQVLIEVVGARISQEGTNTGFINVVVENKTEENIRLNIDGPTVKESASEAANIIKSQEKQRITLVYGVTLEDGSAGSITDFDELMINFHILHNTGEAWEDLVSTEVKFYATSIGGPYEVEE